MFYAKSKPDILSVEEHTNDVVKGLRYFKKVYGHALSGMTEEMWDLLELICVYHDLGKYSIGFQQAIRKAIADTIPLEKVVTQLKNISNNPFNYPHNYLSTTFMPYEELVNEYGRILTRAAIYAVGFHHEKRIIPTAEEIEYFYLTQVRPCLSYVVNTYDVPIAEDLYGQVVNDLVKRNKVVKARENNKIFKPYVLLKGLLQRIDHAVSAKRQHEPVDIYIEQGVMLDIGEQTKSFLSQYGLRPMQKWAYENQDKNILLVAQTGSGKTEAALLWAGKDKAFLTLPLRTSLNALYDRITDVNKIGFANVGLLHGTALDYLLGQAAEKETGIDVTENYVLAVEHTKRFANKFTLSTIDQLMKFSLFYRGFETELATLAYSKIIIDEIQAYDAHIVAILLHGLKLIHEFGGHFMIMTATLPEIFLDALKEFGLMDGEDMVEATYLLKDDTEEDTEMPRRHRIGILDNGILDKEVLEIIVRKGRHEKVLVVVNTVAQSIALYNALKDYQAELENSTLELLHSRFTLGHRKEKEQAIYSFGQLNQSESGIWISTQIVEASLDIDFDYLFTEPATPDALFQRFGRCNRKGLRFNGEIPPKINVYICSSLEKASGVGTSAKSVYEYKIVENGLAMLKPYQGEVLFEHTKNEIVARVFSREKLTGTNYLRIFDDTLEDLEDFPLFENHRTQAQEILRGKMTSLQIIPACYINEVDRLLADYQELILNNTNENKLAELKSLEFEILSYTVSVNIPYKKDEWELEKVSVHGFEHLEYGQNMDYSYEKGLSL